MVLHKLFLFQLQAYFAYPADKVMTPGNACQQFHCQQAEDQHDDKKQGIKNYLAG